MRESAIGLASGSPIKASPAVVSPRRRSCRCERQNWMSKARTGFFARELCAVRLAQCANIRLKSVSSVATMRSAQDASPWSDESSMQSRPVLSPCPALCVALVLSFRAVTSRETTIKSGLLLFFSLSAPLSVSISNLTAAADACF